LFHDGLKRVPQIVNDYNESTKEEKLAFNKLIYTKYSGDLLSNLPTCECGELAGEYLVDPKNPVICPNCHTPVKPQIEQELQPMIWIRKPNGVQQLINPIVWTMLRDRFTKSNFEVVRWMCDTTYKPPGKIPANVLDPVLALNYKRGYNNFVENFDNVIKALFELKPFRLRKGEVDPLQTLLRVQRDCVFSDYLPLPNRALLVIEETNVGTYVDPTIVGAIDAIRTMTNIDSPLSSHNVRTKENRTIKTIAQIAEFYEGLHRTTLAKKEGVFRKHVFGTRSHFSFRAVISSLTDKHRYDELHIPWGIGVSVFRLHLKNKLFRRGFTPNQADAFLNKHAQLYNPELDLLFQELIAESPYPGIPVVFQRNPSLERGSAQAMFITKVKTDVDVPTVSLSILSVKGFNADFDGDQLNGTLSLDHMTAEELRALAPHKSIFGLDDPYAVSGNASMPKPVVATIANFVHWHEEDADDPEKARKMALIPEAT
jgi:hypothetical protein